MPALASLETVAFEDLVRKHQSGLFALLLARTGCRETATDLLQDTLLAAWRNRDALLSLADEARASYLWAAARRKAVDWIRSRYTRRVACTRALGDNEQPPVPQPEPEPEPDPRLAALDAVIAGLAEDERELVHLAYVAGLGSADIGHRLGLKPGTVRVRLHRLRERLKRRLEAGVTS